MNYEKVEIRYVLYNKESGLYNGYECNFENAYKYNNLNEAEFDLKWINAPEEWEIHKIKVTYEFEEVVGDNLNIISSEDDLKDVTPIKWREEVLNGSKKVIIS